MFRNTITSCSAAPATRPAPVSTTDVIVRAHSTAAWSPCSLPRCRAVVLTPGPMAYDGYQALRIRIDGGVAFVTIDHPPINLLDLALIQELDRAGRALETDPDVRVVVLDSADPEFFIAHADVQLIQQLPAEPPPRPTSLVWFHAIVDRFRTMPK